MLPEPLDATLQVASVFERLKVPYVIVGSIASTVHGVVRTTQDSDLVAELRPEHVEDFLVAVMPDFHTDEALVTNAIAGRGSFNLIHRQSFFKVDVFIPSGRAFDASQLSRAQRQTLSMDPPAHAQVATAEDVLLAKLDWFRQGGESSERQWRDVLGIIQVQGDRLDSAYLRRWAVELRVSDLLDRALAGD